MQRTRYHSFIYCVAMMPLGAHFFPFFFFLDNFINQPRKLIVYFQICMRETSH